MGWRERAVEAEHPERRERGGFGAVEARVGRDDADRRVLRRGEAAERGAGEERAGRIHEAPTLGGIARAGDEGAGIGVAHVTDGVDRHERADDDLAEPHAHAADAAPHCARDPVNLAHARPGARADTPLGHGARDGARGGLVPHLARRSCAAVADAEVEQKGARYVRDDGRACCEADAALLEPTHDAVDRFLTEPAAAAEDDAVNRRDQVAGAEVVEADDVVGASAQLDTAAILPRRSRWTSFIPSAPVWTCTSRRSSRARARAPVKQSPTTYVPSVQRRPSCSRSATGSRPTAVRTSPWSRAGCTGSRSGMCSRATSSWSSPTPCTSATFPAARAT